jgi:hypothetical protein
LIENKETDTTGKEKTISGIKGVPLGYQTMGIFYNWKLIKTVPHLWSEIGNNNTSPITNSNNDSSNVSATDGELSQTMTDTPDYADIIL